MKAQKKKYLALTQTSLIVSWLLSAVLIGQSSPGFTDYLHHEEEKDWDHFKGTDIGNGIFIFLNDTQPCSCPKD